MSSAILQTSSKMPLGTAFTLPLWVSQTLTLVAVVIVLNFFAKWFLKKLHHRFKEQKRHLSDSLVRALYLPLSYFTWYFAFLHGIAIASAAFELSLSIDTTMWIKAGSVIALAWFALRFKKNVIQIMLSKSKNHEIALDAGKIDVVNKLLLVVILFITVLQLLEITGRSATTLIAFGGVGGLALAFASQEIIANFFGGLMIYVTQPFSVGDWINLPDKKIEGHVEEIGWYMTRIRTFEKRPIYIPNSIFTKIIVMTPSRMTHRRFKETFGIRYSDIPELNPIMSEIKTMLEHHPDLDHQLKCSVFLSAFATRSVDIVISAYTIKTNSEDYARIRQDLLLKVYAIICQHGAGVYSRNTPNTSVDISE